MIPIRLTQSSSDARPIDFTVSTQTYNYFAAALVEQPWLYWRLNDVSSPGVDYGIAAPGPTNHPWTGNGVGTNLTLHQAGILQHPQATALPGNFAPLFTAQSSGAPSYARATGGLGHGATNFTVEYLVKYNGTCVTNNSHSGISRDGGGSSAYYFYGGYNGTQLSMLALLFAVGSVNMGWGTGHELEDQAVHQLTWVWTLGSGAGYDVKFYLDAVSLGSQHGDNLQQIQFDSVNVGIGPALLGATSYGGKIQEYRIYGTALSAGSILNHWQNV